MKKFFAFWLCLGLLCSGLAWAEQIDPDTAGTTEISFDVNRKTDYSVIIPPSVQLNAGSGEIQIAISDDSTLYFNKQLTVKLLSSANGFTMVNSSNASYAVPYTVAMNGSEVGEETDLLVWKETDGAIPAPVTLQLIVQWKANEAAGEYSDTLTFAVAVEDM